MSEVEQLYDLLCEIRTASIKASKLAGRLLTQNDVDCVDRIGNIANKLVGRLIDQSQRLREAEDSKAAGV